MKPDVIQQAAQYSVKRRRRKRWQKVVTCLGAAVVFCTTYALILPAITMEHEPCRLTEHTHSSNCWTQVVSVTETRPVCSAEHLNLHRHTELCYNADGEAVCGWADFAVHTHDESCFDQNGSLWCPLPEIAVHEHSDACRAFPDPTHQTAESTADTEEAAETPPVLICGKKEIILHTHTQVCFDETGALICGKTEVREHTHDGTCFAAVEVSADTTVLTCTLPETDGHAHGDGCYDESGALVCGLEEISAHRHTALCRGTWELTCALPEHIHDEFCTPALTEDADDTPAPAVTDDTPPPTDSRTEAAAETPTGEPAEAPTETPTETPTEEPSEAPAGEPSPEPTATGPEYLCGFEAHLHDDLCFDIYGSLICTTGKHEHTPMCLLTEAQRLSVIHVAAMLDQLPTAAEIQTRLAGEGDRYGALIAYQDQICQTLEAYQTLSSSQKAALENTQKLTDLLWVLELTASPPELSGDDAYVSQLSVFRTELFAAETGEPIYPDEFGLFRAGSRDLIRYHFTVTTAAFTDTVYGKGRVKLEFVLPLTAEEAVFDLSDMSWLDTAGEYAPTVTTEVRQIGETAQTCQILTGWILLETSQPRTGVVPGSFEAYVSVRPVTPAHGTQTAVLITAGMEHSAWGGLCPIHEIPETLSAVTEAVIVDVQLSAEEQQAVYDAFSAEIGTLEAAQYSDEQRIAAAEAVQLRLDEAHSAGKLSAEQFSLLYDRLTALCVQDPDTVAEAAVGTNWITLRDSGWFEAYSSYAAAENYAPPPAMYSPPALMASGDAQSESVPPSDVQVNEYGGSTVSEDGAVTVSKTIAGTELENVFDITLTVQTTENIKEVYAEPDMAVVIVMDISQTMNSAFGSTTRYAAAMEAAEHFLDQFAANSGGVSKVGYVVFNTSAYEIFPLQSCSTQSEANALKNTMRTETGAIINADGYKSSHERFTNIQAGIKMGRKMLEDVDNENKYIIFLSDGFPTTYVKSGYTGYDPYTSSGTVGTDGVFYDSVAGLYCDYGTSYSDKAAIKARKAATAAKNAGITIFSIGVDVSSQTIANYLPKSGASFSVVDRTGTTYEIGDASDTDAYKNWLKNSIGSGYYYDSTDSAGLSAAYETIFSEILRIKEESSIADWVANDPMPTVSNLNQYLEFISFYSKDTAQLTFADLNGSAAKGGENTAVYDTDSDSISWDLKESGYTISTSGSTTVYQYELVYRVRLMNETDGFEEGTVYLTNDPTTLTYKIFEAVDGVTTVSDTRTADFLLPSVHGYLSELTFLKVDPLGYPIPGAEFTLSHDTDTCSVCRGDGSSVAIEPFVAVSDANGTVTFTNIPSGHQYTLTETKVPDGYKDNGSTYRVTVAYDEITVAVNGDESVWDGTIVNAVYYELPETGGIGTNRFTAGGLLLITAAALYLLYYKKRRREDAAPP